MRLYNYILPILLASLIACKNTAKQEAPLRVSGFEYADSLFWASNDSAFYYLNEIVTNDSPRLITATAYTYMGIIQSGKGDYFGGTESITNSMALLDERNDSDRYCFGANYFQLGVNNIELKNYQTGINYLNKSLPYWDKSNETQYRLIVLNSLALAYQKTGDYEKSDSLFSSAIDSARHFPKEYARIISNRTRTRYLQQPSYPALPELFQALNIRRSLNDSFGINASYAHLVDYYMNTRRDSALYYGQKRYTLAGLLNSPEDELETLSQLMSLAKGKDLQQYITRFKSLNDSIHSARDSAKNQFALIRYEAEKSKTNNLLLQKDNAEKDVQLLWQRVTIWCTAAFFIAAGTIGFTWHRKRTRDKQLRLYQRIHDIIANGLYQIMTELEHIAIIDKARLLNDIERLYKQSRNISYDAPESHIYEFHQVISDLVNSYKNTAAIFVAGNKQPLWELVSSRSKSEIHIVLQELMVNMKKHSGADNVVLRFEHYNNSVNIYYKDDGIGLPPEVKYGNGLTNTGTRIKSIGGEFIFEPATKGLSIRISIPTDRQS